MFLTQEDYRKIESWLKLNSKKDTDFDFADSIDGSETIAIVQGNKNKRIFLRDFINEVGNLFTKDLVNVSADFGLHGITLETAIQTIPLIKRKEGLVITFEDTDSNWRIYQFIGELPWWNFTDQWRDVLNWESFAVDSLLPDEEDITATEPDGKGNAKLKFADREYNPDAFSGLGHVILRKNLIEVMDPETGKSRGVVNYLYQDMINKENTIYEIRYDFNLDGEAVTIPNGCILNFKGGTLANGTLIGNDTCIDAAPVQIVGTSPKVFKRNDGWSGSVDEFTTFDTPNVTLRGTWNVKEAYPEWGGADNTGVKDSTKNIQFVMDNFSRIYFDGEYLTRQIDFKDNRIIEMSPRTVIYGNEGFGLNERLFNIDAVSNVTIYGNNSKLDLIKGKRTYDTDWEKAHGEYMHNVFINSANNVEVYDLNSYNSGGDGFVLAHGGNKNIKLIGCVSDGNRRQGLSIINGVNVWVDKCIFRNTKGTAPRAGIDIEPNYADGYFCDNVHLSNIITENNGGAGLLLAMSLKTTTGVNDNVSIHVDNFTSINDDIGISLQNMTPGDIKGHININNMHVFGSKFLTVGRWGVKSKLKTNITNCYFEKTLTKDTAPVSNSVIIGRTENDGTPYDPNIGGITVDDLTINNATTEALSYFVYLNFVHKTSEAKSVILEDFNITNMKILSDNTFNEYGHIFDASGIQGIISSKMSVDTHLCISNFSKYGILLFDKYEITASIISLAKANILKNLNRPVRFSRNVGFASTVTFKPESGDKLFDSNGDEITTLVLADPEGLVVGGRKKYIGEYIELIPREDGWYLFDSSQMIKNTIRTT